MLLLSFLVLENWFIEIKGNRENVTHTQMLGSIFQFSQLSFVEISLSWVILYLFGNKDIEKGCYVMKEVEFYYDFMLVCQSVILFGNFWTFTAKYFQRILNFWNSIFR